MWVNCEPDAIIEEYLELVNLMVTYILRKCYQITSFI